MYPLPPELSEKIMSLLENKNVSPDKMDAMHDKVACLFVRENRRMRLQVLKLRRSFTHIGDDEESTEKQSMAAYLGESACNHILREIIRPNVYFNSEEAEERAQAVEDFIQGFYKEDDPTLPG